MLVIGAGAGGTVAGEFHPESGWVTSTALGGMSVDGLALNITGTGGTALGLVRFTQLGNAADNDLEYTTWTAGAGTGTWTALAGVGAGITTSNAPALGTEGATSLGAFRGFDDNYYVVTFTGGVWSGASPVEPAGGGQSSGPDGPSYDPFTGTFAFGGDNEHLYTQVWNGSAWAAAEDEDSTNLSSLSPTVVGVAPFGEAALLAYVRASDGQIFFESFAAGAWSGPSAIASALTNDPVALSPTASGAVLAFRGQDGNAYTSVYAAGAWSTVAPFATPNVSLEANPALARGVGAATAEIAFVETDGVAYHARLIGGTWTAPVAVGGASLDHVALASYAGTFP